ncbi:MAG TPA: GNAT family N-acetyltransferase [Opitutaceae bacterium]
MIRFATPVDAGRIGEIHVVTWRAAYRGIVPDAFLESLSVGKRAAGWRRGIEADPQLVLVSEHEGKIDGWVAIGTGRDDDTKTEGEVYALYVAPESWRQGIGRALMEKAEEELWNRALNRTVLWVLEQNDRALRFYESLHYSADGRTKEVNFTDTTLTELRYEKRK